MAYTDGSELSVRLALAIGLLALAVTLALVLQVWLMRWRTQRIRTARQRVVAQWRPLLLRLSVDEGADPPTLRAREVEPVVLLWNQLMDGVRGATFNRLRQLGHRIGLHAVARRWLARGSDTHHLLALVTLGHLANQTDWGRVRTWLRHPRPSMSLAAAQALIDIAPAEGVKTLLDELPQRPDWPLARIDTLLRLAGPSHAREPVRQLLRRAAPEDLVRWLPLVQPLDARDANALLTELLERTPSPAVTAAALGQVTDRAAAVHARRAAGHETWWVRVRAATALGRIGDTSDLPRLVDLMSDPQWWVRYRAAQAIHTLTGGDEPRLTALWRTLDDDFARDMLQQVIAERRPA